jgi:hypothetical protein
VTGVELPPAGGEGPEAVIDFRPDSAGVPAGTAAGVVALYEANVLEKEIARRLGLGRSIVTRILDDRDAARGGTGRTAGPGGPPSRTSTSARRRTGRWRTG